MNNVGLLYVGAVLFGDYFYVEALMKLLRPGRFLPQPARLPG